MELLNNRYEFVYLFDVENGNPNGDPDAGNMPRIDAETSHGIVTDVCLKRKIRNYVEIAKKEESGFKIYVKEKAVLNRQHELAYEAKGLKPESKKLPKDEQKAKELNASLAGERSGHIFYRHHYYGYDDAVFACLKVLEYLSEQDQSLSELILALPQYITSPAWQAECADEVKYEIVDRLTEQFKKEYGSNRVIDINGARVSFDEGWGLVRASSNLPALVLVFESKTKKGLKNIENIFREKLAQYSEVGKKWSSG